MPLREERKTRRPNEGELLARYALHSIRPSWPNVAQEVTTAVLELKQETLAAARLRILRFSCWFAASCKPYRETMGSSMSHTRLDEDSILRNLTVLFYSRCICVTLQLRWKKAWKGLSRSASEKPWKPEVHYDCEICYQLQLVKHCFDCDIT